MNQYMLKNLKDQHRYLDNMITELESRKFPNEYITPYKKRKLTIKEYIVELERENSL
mgnify:FL=1